MALAGKVQEVYLLTWGKYFKYSENISGVFGSVRECSGVFGSVRECSGVFGSVRLSTKRTPEFDDYRSTVTC
jgi:hypothetical protein